MTGDDGRPRAEAAGVAMLGYRDNPEVLALMKVGTQYGSDELSIVDDGSAATRSAAGTTLTLNASGTIGTVVNPNYVTSALPVIHLFAPASVLQPGPSTGTLG